MSLERKGTNICASISPEMEKIILIAVFIIGFCLFKFIFGREDPEMKKEKEIKAKLVEEYLEKYKKENEEFFFDTTIDSS
jgi:hypothetical protein